MTCTRIVALTTVCLLTATVAASEAPLKSKPAGTASNVKPAPADCPACAMGMTAEKVFARLDVDGNKTVTVEEFMRSPGMSDQGEARAAVGRIDTDGDGALSWVELAEAYKERHAKCPKVDPSKAGVEGRGNRSRFAMVFMMQNDKNGDGAVDKSEFRGSDARFDQMDKNANGKLESDELADLHASRMNDPKSMRERLASGDLPRRPPSKSSSGISGPKGASKPQAEGRKCPADRLVIGGQDIAKILTILGAKREVGASDEQLQSYANHFDRTDPNHDGQHTRVEYVERGGYMTPQARAGIFRAADNNADGVVTRTEYVLNRIITDEAKGIVQQTDADKDGRVTGSEFVEGSPIEDKAMSRALFDALDTSRDGMITVPEYLRVWGGWARPNYKAQEAALAARLAKLGQERHGGTSGKPDQGGRPAGGPPSVEHMFQVMDRDQDNELSKAEFRGPSHVFTAADKNENGRVTRAEMEAFRARTGKGGPGGASRRGPGRERTKFATPHALDPAIVKEGHNRVVDSDGNEVPPQGRPIQQGYRLIRVDRFIEDHNQRAYAKVFSIMAPIRDALIHHPDTTSPAQWKRFTSILEKNDIKTRQWLKGPTPRDNYYSSRGIFEYLRSTYAGNIPADAVPGNIYADRDYHAMMKYLDEAELELKCRTFSPDFDFTNPEGVNPCPHTGQGLMQ